MKFYGECSSKVEMELSIDKGFGRASGQSELPLKADDQCWPVLAFMAQADHGALLCITRNRTCLCTRQSGKKPKPRMETAANQEQFDQLVSKA